MSMEKLSDLARILGAQLHGADAAFPRVVTDTRALQPGDLFVALAGERFDAHDFLADAAAKGAVGGTGSGSDASDPRFAAAIIPEPLLFNLATDPGEKNNIIAQHPEKAEELAARLKSIVANPSR